MARYYHVVNKNEARAPGAGIVELPPENVFWSPLPPGEQLTYDMADLPNGTEPIPVPAPTVASDLDDAGIDHLALTKALYKDYLGDSSDIIQIGVDIAAIAMTHSVTEQEVRDAV